MPDRKATKLKAEGSGAPPGLKWSVLSLSFAKKEQDNLLSESQREHLKAQVCTLASEDDPGHSIFCSVDKVEDFFELREWGGPLNGLNVRLFFGLCKKARAIVILGIISKQNNGPTPLGDKVRMRVRWRRYKSGEYD